MQYKKRCHWTINYEQTQFQATNIQTIKKETILLVLLSDQCTYLHFLINTTSFAAVNSPILIQKIQYEEITYTTN